MKSSMLVAINPYPAALSVRASPEARTRGSVAITDAIAPSTASTITVSRRVSQSTAI